MSQHGFCCAIPSTIFILLCSLAMLCILRTYVFVRGSKIDSVINSKNPVRIFRDDATIKRFSEALTYKTITKGPQDYDKEELVRFSEFLLKSFPLIHSSPKVRLEKINNYSLLYNIEGTDCSLKPYMLVSHMDVVPADSSKWDVDPFGGVVKDGFIFGRGAIDVKDTLMGAMEALERLLSEDFEFSRPFYLAFGHDEEGNGLDGAQHIAKTLEDRGVELEFILDEGGFIIKNMFEGVHLPVAMIGVSEKGYVTYKLEIEGQPGHSSMPIGETTIVTMSKATAKLDALAMPSRFGQGPEKGLVEAMAPHAEFPYNILYSNLWLFSPLVSYIWSKGAATNAYLRTSTAVTIMNGGVKENVLPSYCMALVNHRIHTADSVAEVMKLDEKIINDDRIKISPYDDFSAEPAPISPYDQKAFGYQVIGQSVENVYPDAVVAPSLMLASTDSKWYHKLTKNIYRFTPPVLDAEDLKLMHGDNERISIDNYILTVDFFHFLIPAANRVDHLSRFSKDEL